MRKFFENKAAFLAVLSTFTFAITWNIVHGTAPMEAGHLSLAPAAVLVAHGPIFPPDP